jgi:hypothetical protein
MPMHASLSLLLIPSMLSLGSLVAAAPRGGDAAPGFQPDRRADAVRAFVQDKPGVRLYETTNPRQQIKRIYGRAFSNGDSVVASAENFKRSHAGILGVTPDQLTASRRFRDGRQTVPVMFDKATGQYKFTAVYYSQSLDGIPVFDSELVVLVRNQANFPAVLASTSIKDLGGFTLARQPIGEPHAAQVAPAAVAKLGADAIVGPAHYVIWAGTEDAPAQPRLAIQAIAEHGVSGDADHQKWLLVVDATTGRTLHEVSGIYHGSASGTVEGLATQGVAADVCGPEPITPLPHLRISLGEDVAYTDASGAFTVPVTGVEPQDLTLMLWGKYFRVFNQGAADALLTAPVGDGAAGVNFLFNPDNNEEFERAEVNGYVQANAVRDYVLSIMPDYPGVAEHLEMPVNVNIDATCNASYDGTAINFRRAGGCPNTAFSTVVYHEYGHHLVEKGDSGQGAYGEGMSDCIAVIMTDQPELGLGWEFDCDVPLRSAVNDRMYPCSGGIHFCGQVLSGSVWETRNELALTEPTQYRDMMSSLVLASIQVHTGTNVDPSITIDFLTLDDDDDEILNGTPHYDEIATGFGEHNMDAPALALLDFNFPDGQPEYMDPAGGDTVRIEVGGVTDTPVAGQASFFVDVGGGFAPGTLVPVAPNVYDAVFPASTCGNPVRYYFTAQADGGGSEANPVGAPATSHLATSAAAVNDPTFDDDFETDQSWVVTDSVGLTDGTWERGVPAGDGTRGDPTVDADGSGQCYLTHNGEGNTDVDGGTTTLTSPVMDATVGDEILLSYHRWYSNTEGADPENDVFVVEISSNGGSSWINLETVGPDGPEVDGGWFFRQYNLGDLLPLTSQFRIRFKASDLGDGSVVEAAVDGVSLIPVICEATVVGDLNGDGIVNGFDLALLLGAWGPCLGCPADLDGSGVVNGFDLAILLGEWG